MCAEGQMKYTFFFTSRDEIKVIFTTNIWIFFLLYTSLSIEEMQILQNLSCFPLTIYVNKKKSSSGSYIFHCSEEWKYKFYIFISENITFSKYAFYFINNSQYFITLYIIKIIKLFLISPWIENCGYSLECIFIQKYPIWQNINLPLLSDDWTWKVWLFNCLKVRFGMIFWFGLVISYPM